MNELIDQEPDREQAMLWVEEVRRGLNNVRHYLLKIRDTKAYKALGYDSFEELGQAEFGFSEVHIARLVNAAKIENNLKPIGLIPESQLRPLTGVPKEDQKAVFEAAQEENKRLTAKAVQEAVDSYKEKADKTAEEWRQQFLDERGAAREIKEELKTIKASKKEIIYVDDSEKALEQYKEETAGKLLALKESKEKAEENLTKVKQEIDVRVSEKLNSHKEEIEALQKQETSLLGSIDLLDKQWDELSNGVGNRVDNEKAIKLCLHDLEMLSIHAGVLDENDCTEDEKEEWRAFFNKMINGAEYYLKLL